MYKALDLWLPAYLCRRSSPKPTGARHILLAICDHFEPLHGVDKSTALERIRRWFTAMGLELNEQKTTVK